MILPKVSIITCTYNGERVIRDYFEGIFNQDYPLDKIEVIIADGGSTDSTLKIIEEFKTKYPKNILFVINEKRYKVGRGKGVDLASKYVKGEIIILIDQDNLLIQKNWISNAVNILMRNKNISAVQSRLKSPSNSKIVDKYLNSTGIEDPFVFNYSLNSQITFYPNKFKFDSNLGVYLYNVNRKRFYYGGDNGFLIWKNIFFETGGYTQDIDNFYRMALSRKKYTIAVPKNMFLYHKSSTTLKDLLSKKTFYVKHYLLENYDERDFFWFDIHKNSFNQNLKFIYSVVYNLSFIPGFFKGIQMSLKKRNNFWMIHSFLLWLITFYYIKSFFHVLIFKKQTESKI